MVRPASVKMDPTGPRSLSKTQMPQATGRLRKEGGSPTNLGPPRALATTAKKERPSRGTTKPSLPSNCQPHQPAITMPNRESLWPNHKAQQMRLG